MAPERSDRGDVDAPGSGGAPGVDDPTDRLDDGTPDDSDVDGCLRELHDHLDATASLPVETAASRWLGEAEAVVADVARGDAPPEAIATRVRQVGELLSHVEGTGNAEADEHVEAARGLVDELDEVVDSPEGA